MKVVVVMVGMEVVAGVAVIIMSMVMIVVWRIVMLRVVVTIYLVW